MMNPDASVVVIDTQTGIELTNRIAPADNARIIRDCCAVSPDVVLVDGLHSNEQIVLDFDATFAVCGREAHYFFHDDRQTLTCSKACRGYRR